jgi:hypothetical protein
VRSRRPNRNQIFSRADVSGVASLEGWLRTVVSRICLDMLRTRTSRREEPLGSPGSASAPQDDPEQEAHAHRLGRPGDARGAGPVVLAFTVRDGRVAGYDVIADPARLGQLDLAVLGEDAGPLDGQP